MNWGREVHARAFLLARARTMDVEDQLGRYDPVEQLTVQLTEGRPVALVQMARTTSKTNASPGDDDADPSSEICL